MTGPAAGSVVIATQNDKKKRELLDLVAVALAEPLEVRTLADVGLADLEIVEDADTFAGNARRKVDAVHAALAAEGALDGVVAILADDSGIEADALGGAPGVRSARYAEDHGAGAGDAANNALLLRALADTPDQARTGRFVCAIAVQVIGGPLLEARGAVEGRIARDERGDGGFGYDPLFVPDAHPTRRMAELSPDEKHAISHRGEAMRAALEMLRAHVDARRGA